MATADPGLIRAIPRRRRSAVRARPGGSLAVLLGALLVVSTRPLARVVLPDAWFPLAIAIIVIVLATGYVVRRLIGTTVGAIVAQVIVAATLLWLGLAGPLQLPVPTPMSMPLVIDMLTGALAAAIEEVRVGVAPLAPTAATTTLIAVSITVATIVLDVVVCRFRLALFGVLGALTIALVPGIILPDGADLIVAAVIFALGVALLVVSRSAPVVSRARRAGLAVALTTVSAVAAFAVLPMVPTSAGADGTVPGLGPARSIDSTLDLGRDLRQPRVTPVLSYRSDADEPLYLRLAVMSSFTGREWTPDASPAASLDWLRTTSETIASGVAVKDHTANITTEKVSSDLLPVPAEAGRVDGVQGTWLVRQGARTVFTHNADAKNQDYAVDFRAISPTQQQLRDATNTGSSLRPGNTDLPDDVPAIVRARLDEVTSDAPTAFDKLMALQNWFRSSAFTYSLDAPVADDYDGTGVQAIGTFLDTRQGYCVHFASTFAVMARELGLPARVVLGFLPGDKTSDSVDDEDVYAVTSAQLHTWPEVYFDGIGWVAFEPTPSIASAAVFAEGSAASDEPTPGASTSAAPSVAPTSSTSAQPDVRPDIDAGGAGGTSGPSADPRVLLIVVGALVVLAAPGLIRVVQRRVRYAAVRRGDPQAAWREAVATAVDLGIPIVEGGSVRQVAAALDAEGRTLPRLRDALEQTAYRASGTPVSGADLVDMVEDTRGTWAGTRPLLWRAAAVALPRSLWRRPPQRAFQPDGDEAAWSRPPVRTR